MPLREIDEVLEGIQLGESTYDAKNIERIKALNEKGFSETNIVDDTSDNTFANVTEVSVTERNNVELSIHVKGGELVAGTYIDEYGSNMVCIGYKIGNKVIDLARAEVLKNGNKDVDLFLFENPNSDCYTKKTIIPYDDIAKATSKDKE
jgi:acetylornithine deacetylase/succinyl-diaminopimelate desuccinylase-like protein